jgi:PAS domain S-box-containing protein
MSLLKKVENTLSSGTNGMSQNGTKSANGNVKFIREEKFALLLNSIPSVISYVDKNQYLQYVNKAFEKVFELDGHSVVGRPIADFLGKDAYYSLKKHIETALSGKPVHYEMEVPLKDGKRFIDATYTPDFDEEGKVNGYIALINDITEKKKTEKELKRKQYELQDYVDNATIGLHWVNANGIITWANKAELNMLGYSPEEYIGHPIAEFHVNKDKIDDILKRLLSDEELHQYEAELRHKDGSVRTVLINSNVFREDEKFIHSRCFTTDITGHKQTEDRLLESESRYRALIENIPAALYTCDATGRIMLYNKAAADLWGREPEIGKDRWCGSWKIYEPDGITPMELGTCPMALTLKEGRPVTGKEIIIERPDGKKRNVQPYPVPIFDKTGKIAGAVNMLLDITERKIADREAAQLAAIVHSSADPIISKTLSGIITSWNEAAERVFGYTADEMIGQPLTKLIPEDRLNEEPLILERLRNGEMVEHFETKRITKDRKLLDISLTISPVKDKNGYIIGASKIARDVTAQKALHEALSESELVLKTISNASPVGLWMTDTNAQNIFVNDTWIKWTGIPFEKQLGTGWLDRVMEEDKVDAPSKFWECLLKREKYSAEFRIIRADGKLRWCLTEGSPYYNIEGKFAGYAGSVTDITDMKKLEERKDDFIKMASHELKTPITSIKGYVQLLLNIYNEANEEKFQASRQTVKSSLNTISKQVSKLTRLISELLDLSRIESGKLELNKTVFDISDLVEETVQDVRQTTSQHAIIVHNDFKGNIYADKDRICQVLLNLLTNAIKYSPDSDRVEVYVEGDKKMVTIKVKDHGIGIDKKDHDKIFERFYRVEGRSEQTYPGFGIGLFIACEIVQRHGGTVFVDSKKDKGAIFTVTLPLDERN